MLQSEYSWAFQDDESIQANIVCSLEATLMNLKIASIGDKEWSWEQVHHLVDNYVVTEIQYEEDIEEHDEDDE